MIYVECRTRGGARDAGRDCGHFDPPQQVRLTIFYRAMDRRDWAARMRSTAPVASLAYPIAFLVPRRLLEPPWCF